MSVPLDRNVANRTGWVRFSRRFSNVVSPPVMFAILGLALAWRDLDWLPGFLWAAAYGLLVSLAPILFVLFLLKTGRISELHMSRTSERHLPYLVATLLALLMWFISRTFDGPPLLSCLLVFNVLELAVLGLINIYWLISIHTTGIMATWLIVGLAFGWAASLIVFPFVIAVAIVRLYLKRHTPAQVLAGYALGIASVLAVSALGCF